MNDNGISTTTEPGSENYEHYTNYKGQSLFQYDYRHTDGELFSCIKGTLKSCKDARGIWIWTNEQKL
jgi:hypothetical protein